MHHQPSKLQQPANEEHFELYECADCGELSAVPAGDQCPAHDCSISNNEDISDAEDDECERCSQLSSVCVCRGESQYTRLSHAEPRGSDDSDVQSDDEGNVPLFSIYDDMPSPVHDSSDFDV